jgi:hypothetical protein
MRCWPGLQRDDHPRSPLTTQVATTHDVHATPVNTQRARGSVAHPGRLPNHGRDIHTSVRHEADRTRDVNPLPRIMFALPE